jgi:hypothetical protein
MNIIIGSGNARKSFTIGHRQTMSRDDRDRIREDLKAFITRPATFVGHSRGVK